MKPLVILPILALACGTLTTIPAVDTEPTTEIIIVNATSIPVSTQAIVCNSGGLNLRSGAGLEYGVIAVLADGSIVEIIGSVMTDASGELWQQVEGGWVDAVYLCPG